jgi:ferrous iron transport protein A
LLAERWAKIVTGRDTGFDRHAHPHSTGCCIYKSKCDTIALSLTLTTSWWPEGLPAMLLNELPNGSRATVSGLHAASNAIDEHTLLRLGELGFIPGEPVELLRRGPGGSEPLAVLIGNTLLGLRLLEAQCVEVDIRLSPGTACAQ